MENRRASVASGEDLVQVGEIAPELVFGEVCDCLGLASLRRPCLYGEGREPALLLSRPRSVSASPQHSQANISGVLTPADGVPSRNIKTEASINSNRGIIDTESQLHRLFSAFR